VDDTEFLVEALLEVRDGNQAAAVAAARRAAGSTLGRELIEQWEGVVGQGVYHQPAAFTAFVRGGGNVKLYTRLSDELARLYDELEPAELVDVGCGDGLALAPALERAAWAPGRIDLVEPSAALLEAASTRLTGRNAHAWELTAQQFFAEVGDRRWPLAQATFSLQSVPPEDRAGVLRALREHADKVVIVEFDVPEYVEPSIDHVRSLVTRYERGIAEYGEDAHLVAQGFLLPVLLGQVVPDGVRTNWEKPAATWAEQLSAAGFADVVVTPLADYWWSPAVLITAS
jgi:SAM-dependent methyltransferase